jgi:cleavage and polyadenylation specificity factor subunit 2
MITFTPFSGAARSSPTVPLAYLLQVDDIRILLDCGSPDWNPENIKTEGNEVIYPWQEYCDIVRK